MTATEAGLPGARILRKNPWTEFQALPKGGEQPPFFVGAVFPAPILVRFGHFIRGGVC
jgi:hypothetical protein